MLDFFTAVQLQPGEQPRTPEPPLIVVVWLLSNFIHLNKGIHNFFHRFLGAGKGAIMVNNDTMCQSQEQVAPS